MIRFIIGLAKYIIFIFNFVFVILGSLLIVYGLLPIVNGGYDSTLSKIAIAVGVLVFVISFLGCCGAVRENRHLLTAHAAILIILFLIQIIVIMVIIGVGSISYDAMEKKLSKFIYSKDANDVDYMKYIEKWLDCCGVYNSTDYTGRGLPLPGSCCGESDDVGSHNERTCTIGMAYKDGCGPKFRDYIDDNYKSVTIMVLGLAVFQIFGAIFTLWTRDHLTSR